MKMIFLYVLVGVSVVHLVSRLFKGVIFQAVTKALLVPLILAIYVSGGNKVFIPVVAALVFGWIGDILLIKIDDIRFFRLGLAAFLLGHIIYIPSMLFPVEKINIIALVISLLSGAALGFFIHRTIRPNREMRIPSIAYESVIILLVASAVQLFLFKGHPFGTLVLTGSLFFIISDSMLAFFTFRSEPRIGQFLVMLTYITAQLCIILGFAGIPH